MAAPKIDYTARDFDAIKLALRAHLEAKFPDTWRDFYESQMGMAWLELVAYVGDILSFYLDYQANEVYLSTARDRLSVINICKLVGYKLRPATSAAVTVTATLPAIQAVDVVVPEGTTVSTGSGVTFRTLSEQRISLGGLTGNIVFTEGELHGDTFISTGATFQKFRLLDAGVISGSIAVTVDGAEWSEVDSLVFGDETSTVYAVSYDEDDYGYIEFGDGSNGMIPPVSTTIQVAYRVGGGLRGNIRLNELDVAITGYLDDGLVTPIAVDIANDEQRGGGGEDRETVEHAKYWAPRWVSTNGRAVTERDFDTLAEAFSDPAYGTFAFVKAKLKQEIPELNTIEIYTWARDSEGDIAEPSTGLKAALQTYFMNNGAGAVRLICTGTEVLNGLIAYIDISLTATISSLLAAADVDTSVTASLDALFSSSENRPGADFRLSRAYDAIQDSSGVEHAIIDNITASEKVAETVATGDGVETNFVFTLDLEPNLPVLPSTVRISAGTQVATDDGDGNLVINSTTVGTVDYDTGLVDITFPSAPSDGQSVNAEHRRILDYQRGELEFAADGSSQMNSAVKYPPVVPYDTVTGEKGIALTDGYQVVRDTHGDGNLYDGSGVLVGTIDYDTGAYNFAFPMTPATGSEIRSTYRQMLQTPSEDIPILKTQLAVKGVYTITTRADEE